MIDRICDSDVLFTISYVIAMIIMVLRQYQEMSQERSRVSRRDREIWSLKASEASLIKELLHAKQQITRLTHKRVRDAEPEEDLPF